MSEPFVKMSSNLGVRDKTVKVLQYGSRMLLWYYSSRLSNETELALKNTMTFASAARKLFRLLKSFDSIRQIVKIYHSNSGTAEDNLLGRLEIVTQAIWAIFFYYDNQLFLARARVMLQDPMIPYRKSNVAWFAADSITLYSCLLRLCFYYRKRCNIIDRIEKLTDEPEDADTVSGGSSLVHVSTTALYWVEALTSLLVGTPIPDTSACSSLPAIGVEDELRQLHTQLDSLGPRKRNALIWFIVKAVFDVGVSGGMEPIFLGQRLGYSNLSNGGIGFAAVCSSLMNIYEVWCVQNPDMICSVAANDSTNSCPSAKKADEAEDTNKVNAVG